VYTPAYEGELRLSGPAVSTFAVQFSAPFFQRFLDGQVGPLDRLAEGIDKGQMHALAPVNPSATPTMKAIMYDVLHCPFKGFSKRLFLEAKVLELLALQIDQTGAGYSSPTTALKPDDVDKLLAAKEWLNEHFLQPITLLEVARLVGLNDFKLKKGFRVLFNTTVFGYMTNLRMSHARRLLLDNRQTVTEVADALGYQHVHHFAHAFRKHFGHLPSELRA
jgi:AraC-like DNA-binding protein